MAIHLLYGIMLSSLSVSFGCEPGVFQVGGVTFDRICIEASAGQSAMTLLDANQDGHLDLAVVNEDFGELVLYVGDGAGKLTRTGRLAAGQNPTSVIAGDINGDGHDDFVVANHETTYLTLLVGDGKGAFEAADNSPLNVPVKPHPHMVRLEDLDQDGNLDIIVDHRSGEGLMVLSGLGTGSFASSAVLINVGGDPYRGFSLGDLNGDNFPDIVTPNPREIGITLSAGDQMSFYAPRFLSSQSPFAVDLGDINGDGRLDVIAASNGGNKSVQLFFQSEHGRMVEADASPFSMASGAKQLGVGDFNGDGFNDAIIGCWNNALLILLGGKEEVETLSIPGVGAPWGMAVGDLNEDGLDDFIVGDGVAAEAQLFLSRKN